MCLFGNDLEGDFYGDFFVKFDGGNVFANFFYGLLDFDELAVDVVAEFLEGFGNLDVVYRTENRACCRSLCADGELDALELCCEGFGVGLDFGEFVSALALVFCQNLKSRVAGDVGMR